MIGALVDGRFDIEREVATGGMGRIYLARDRQSDRPVAFAKDDSGQHHYIPLAWAFAPRFRGSAPLPTSVSYR